MPQRRRLPRLRSDSGSRDEEQEEQGREGRCCENRVLSGWVGVGGVHAWEEAVYGFYRSSARSLESSPLEIQFPFPLNFPLRIGFGDG